MKTTAPPDTLTSAWIEAARPRTLPLALASIGMGAFLAAAAGAFRPLVVLLCVLTTLALQILSNLANDYGDSIHGADSVVERVGPQRAVQSGRITSGAMLRAIIVTAALAAVGGAALVWLALGLAQLLLAGLFLLLGAAAIWAAVSYTASDRPYGYVGLGDLFVMIFFGYVGVLGTFFLQAQALPLDLLLPATSLGLFSVAVLNVNNVRDIDSDRLAGKRSIPVRVGRRRAAIYHWALLGGGLVAALIYVLLNYQTPWQFLFVATLPLLTRSGLAVQRVPSAQLDPFLRQTAIATLLFVLTFGVGQLL